MTIERTPAQKHFATELLKLRRGMPEPYFTKLGKLVEWLNANPDAVADTGPVPEKPVTEPRPSIAERIAEKRAENAAPVGADRPRTGWFRLLYDWGDTGWIMAGVTDDRGIFEAAALFETIALRPATDYYNKAPFLASKIDYVDPAFWTEESAVRVHGGQDHFLRPVGGGVDSRPTNAALLPSPAEIFSPTANRYTHMGDNVHLMPRVKR